MNTKFIAMVLASASMVITMAADGKNFAEKKLTLTAR
jgi:hypothetical protein